MALALCPLITEAPIEDKWLATKIFLFGCAVVFGVYLRGVIKHWVIGFGMVRAGGDEATKGNDIIEAASKRSKVAALMLWTIVAVIAFLGKVKPF